MRAVPATAAAILLAACGAAGAATFEVVASPERNAIVMHGPVEREDIARFDTAVMRAGRTKPTVVTLSSNGGDVAAATSIGTRIAAYGFATYAPDNAICASSCGLIWLAGRTRFASATSHIGFHAAFDPQTRVDLPEAKTWILAYFKAVGVPERFIDYVYARSLGQGMEWMTQSRAADYGLAMTVTPSASAPEATGSTDFVDAIDEATAAYARQGKAGLMRGLKARYDAFDAAPSLRSAFRCFAYELAADDVDVKAAGDEGRHVDAGLQEDAWALRIESLLRTLGYDAQAAPQIINTWIRTSNNTVASQR